MLHEHLVPFQAVTLKNARHLWSRFAFSTRATKRPRREHHRATIRRCGENGLDSGKNSDRRDGAGIGALCRDDHHSIATPQVGQGTVGRPAEETLQVRRAIRLLSLHSGCARRRWAATGGVRCRRHWSLSSTSPRSTLITGAAFEAYRDSLRHFGGQFLDL